jgi:hypothetical protein
MGCLWGDVRSTPAVPQRAADFAALQRSTALGQLRKWSGNLAPLIARRVVVPFFTRPRGELPANGQVLLGGQLAPRLPLTANLSSSGMMLPFVPGCAHG